MYLNEVSAELARYNNVIIGGKNGVLGQSNLIVGDNNAIFGSKNWVFTQGFTG